MVLFWDDCSVFRHDVVAVIVDTSTGVVVVVMIMVWWQYIGDGVAVVW